MERLRRRERSRQVEEIKPLQKTFLAVRGEIAYRAAKTFAKRGIPAVVPYTFADQNPLASEIVEQNADKGWELAPLGGTSSEENYTNPKILIETIKLYGCDSVFLGFGNLSENAEFVEMCEAEGIRVLAPPSSVMKKVGNKINAREVARHTKIRSRFGWSTIPVIEGSGDLPDIETAKKTATELGYPVMLKDPDGGGGTGNKPCKNEKELVSGYEDLSGKPENKQLFLERFVEKPGHVEFQIVADGYGAVVSLGERDCTMQRKGQKLLEESPSPHISDRLRGVLQQAAVSFARAVDYKGVGTVEFLIDLDRKGKGGDPEWAFMEMNPRLQVEHPVTEEQLKDIDIDMVGLMIDIAEGRRLPFTQKDIRPQGHTIEARVFAENPDRNYAKDSGVVSVFRYPEVEGVRIDPALREGDELSIWYDPTLMKAVSHADTRELAREQLVRLLLGTEIMGVSSNLHFLTELLNTPEFRSGNEGDTNFVEKWWRERLRSRVNDIAEFIGDGTFVEYPPSLVYNPALLPPTSSVVRRDNGLTVTYPDHLEKLEKDKGTICAAKYGIYERDGARLVLYYLDYSINAGTLGPQEANLLVDAAKLAHELGLVLVTKESTGGVDNWTNTLGLNGMGLSVAALTKKYPPRAHINISHGPDYGGTPGSIGGPADWRIVVDADQSHKGLTGIFMVAKGLGIDVPENTRAAEVYRMLADRDEKYKGLHSPLAHVQARNDDLLVTSLGEASDEVMHLIHLINRGDSVVDKTRAYKPRQPVAVRQISTEAEHLERPGSRYPVWFSPVSRFRERLFGRTQPPVTLQTGELTNFERWKMIYEVERPTAADLLDPKFGIFDDVVLLSGSAMHFDNGEWYPPITAAVARIKDSPLLVISQQTSRTVDLNGRPIKKYIPQRPEDMEFLEHVLYGIGLKNKLPALFTVDTEGLAADPEAEARGVIRKLGRTQEITNAYPYTTAALLLGLKGSGGGEMMFRPMDAAAVAGNALAWVSLPKGVKNWIQGGPWVDDSSEEFKRFINGESTARAETLVHMKLADRIIREGSGGAHMNMGLFAADIRDWWVSDVLPLELMSQKDREDRRWDRNMAPNRLFSISVF